MFVVCIGDGLGNQMFQYAFYKEMQYRYPKNRVVVDICNFYGSVNEHNGYELEKIFGLKLEQCTRKKAMQLADYHGTGNKKHPVLNRFWGIRSVLCGRKTSFICVDDPTEYYEEVFQLNNMESYMLRGNWINEMYFKNVKEQVVHDFSFPELDDSKNKEIAHDIRNTNSVSVHIRRGDYVSSGITSASDEFYLQAMAAVREMVGEDVKFFFFSDDIEYVKERYRGNHVYVSNNNGQNSFRDMQLMSLCKHNIIANSTFSFWGAYLNSNQDKVVIAPKIAMKSYRRPFACDDWRLI